MRRSTAEVPVHDITYAMNDILRQLESVKAIAVDAASVQHTIDQIRAAQGLMLTIECCDQSCPFEIVNESELKIAV